MRVYFLSQKGSFEVVSSAESPGTDMMIPWCCPGPRLLLIYNCGTLSTAFHPQSHEMITDDWVTCPYSGWEEQGKAKGNRDVRDTCHLFKILPGKQPNSIRCHLIGQNSISGPHLAAKEAGSFSFLTPASCCQQQNWSFVLRKNGATVIEWVTGSLGYRCPGHCSNTSLSSSAFFHRKKNYRNRSVSKGDFPVLLEIKKLCNSILILNQTFFLIKIIIQQINYYILMWLFPPQVSPNLISKFCPYSLVYLVKVSKWLLLHWTGVISWTLILSILKNIFYSNEKFFKNYISRY